MTWAATFQEPPTPPAPPPTLADPGVLLGGLRNRPDRARQPQGRTGPVIHAGSLNPPPRSWPKTPYSSEGKRVPPLHPVSSWPGGGLHRLRSQPSACSALSGPAERAALCRSPGKLERCHHLVPVSKSYPVDSSGHQVTESDPHRLRGGLLRAWALPLTELRAPRSLGPPPPLFRSDSLRSSTSLLGSHTQRLQVSW